MIKKLLFTLLILTIGMQVNAQLLSRSLDKGIKFTAEQNGNEFLPLGYSNDVFAMSVGTGSVAEFKMYVEFTKEYLDFLKGQQLTKVRIAVGQTNTKEATLLLSNSKEGTPFYTQTFTISPTEWVEITLDEPYTIEEEALFIGYSITPSGANEGFIGCDEGPAVNGGGWLYFGGQWMTLEDGSIDANLCVLGIVEGDNLPEYEVELEKVGMPAKLGVDDEFALFGTIRNRGVKEINSFEVSYQIEGEEPVRVSFEELEIATNRSYSFRINGLFFSDEGTFNVNIEVSELNGNDDAYPSNNIITKEVVVEEGYIRRKVLLEHFTTVPCGFCPAAHKLWKNIIQTRDDVVWVAHHAGYGTDAYTISESQVYLAFYNQGNSTFAPASMLDRTNLADQGAITSNSYGQTIPTPGPVFAITNKEHIESLLDAQASVAGQATLNIEGSYTESNITLTVTGEILDADIQNESLRINIFLSEDGIIGRQSGIDGDYTHDHVMRAVPTGVWGEELTVSSDGKFTFEVSSYALKSNWNTDNMNVVAFVGNYNVSNINDRKVYNSTIIPFSALSFTSGIDGISIDDNIKIYTNNQEVELEGEFTSATIYNVAGFVQGAAVYPNNKVTINNSGIYIVKVTTDSGEVIKKVAVK